MPEVTIVRESDVTTGGTILGMRVKWPGGRVDHARIPVDGFQIAYRGGLSPEVYAKLFAEYLTTHDDGK